MTRHDKRREDVTSHDRTSEDVTSHDKTRHASLACRSISSGSYQPVNWHSHHLWALGVEYVAEGDVGLAGQSHVGKGVGVPMVHRGIGNPNNGGWVESARGYQA